MEYIRGLILHKKMVWQFDGCHILFAELARERGGILELRYQDEIDISCC